MSGKAKATATARRPTPAPKKRAAPAKAKAKATSSGSRTKPRAAKAKPRADKATPRAKPRAAKPAARATSRAKPRATPAARTKPRAAAPAPLLAQGSSPTPAFAPAPPHPARPTRVARDWSARSSPVVEILDDPHPIGALRRFLEGVRGEATAQQAQIALGAAQLMLLPIAREARGGTEVKELVDLVLERWADFGALRVGFHAQEFLRNAFAAIGVDRERIARLVAVVPAAASSELLFHVAGAHAVARDKVAMLRAVEEALGAGASPAEFRRDRDFMPYAADPDLAVLLARADLPAIPVDVDPYLPAVRGALDHLVASLAELGEPVELRPPVRLDAILDAERAARISLPNDYRALLATTNGMRVWDREFLATADFHEPTALALRARRYLQAEYATSGLSDCVPLASWGGPNDWLLYDPRGRVRRGDPGYVVMLNTDEIPLADLAAALVWLEALARDERGTN